MTTQIHHKRSGFLEEAPVLKRWKPQGAWGGDGMVAPAAEAFELKVQTMRDAKTCFEVEEAMVLQEPTSVLDLQTSPGRSCSSASLSSQPSLSGDETSFPSQNGNDSCSEERNSAGSDVLPGSSTGASAQADQDIASWMDCMEDPHGPLALPDFEECEAGEGHSSELKLEGGGIEDEIDFANTEIDFGFELSLDGTEHESFPNYPVAAGLMSDMLSDPGLCLMDEPKYILLPEGFQDAQRLQELDDSLSSMLSSTNGIRIGGVSQQGEQGVVPHGEFLRLLGSSQSSDSSCRQGSGIGAHQNVAAVHARSPDSDAAAERLGQQQGHNRSESWGSSQAQVQQQQQEPEDSGLHLVHLLLACAEAIDESDFDIARPMLSRLRTISNPYGDPMQRIALYFADALGARLAMESVAASVEGPLEAPPLSSPSVFDSELAYQAFYEILPFAKFAHFTANQAIFEAVGCSNKIHVVDLDIQQGLQWPSFIQSLAMRPGGPPHLRVTAVGTDVARLQLTERRLSEFAQSLDVPFEFTTVVEKVENLQQALFRTSPDEALAINCSQVLHTFAGNPATLEKTLFLLRSLNPIVVTLLEVEANHNGASLISRFVEALHYYCALFDSLEGSLARDSADRFRIENTAFASEIKDIVALEGARRRARHVKSETWQTHFSKSGFRVLPLSSYAVQQAQLLLGLYTTCEIPYKLSEDFGALILGWQDTPVTAVSSWSCC